jgi:hypothetical protein
MASFEGKGGIIKIAGQAWRFRKRNGRVVFIPEVLFRILRSAANPSPWVYILPGDELIGTALEWQVYSFHDATAAILIWSEFTLTYH